MFLHNKRGAHSDLLRAAVRGEQRGSKEELLEFRGFEIDFESDSHPPPTIGKPSKPAH
jgi:hypothetical protein